MLDPSTRGRRTIWSGPLGFLVLVVAAVGIAKVVAELTPLLVVALVYWILVTYAQRK